MEQTRLFTFLLLALLVGACTPSNDRGGSNIELNIEGAGGRTVKFDRYLSGDRTVTVDSVVLDGNGNGVLRLPPLPLDIYGVLLDQQDLLLVALDSTSNLEVKARAGSISSPEQITGAPHTELIHDFFRRSKAFEQRNDSLRNALMANSGDLDLLDQINALSGEYVAYCKEFLQQHSTSPAALVVEGRMDPEREFELLKQVRNGLRPVMPASVFFQNFRMKVDGYEQIELTRRMQEEQAQKMNTLLAIGNVAPEIRQQTPDGDTFALSQLRGKYVLIDFWAAWCRPCRMENPAVKRVYDKYHAKGFEILGVSLDQSREAWVGAIQADGLPWKHVSDLGYWNNAAAQEYGVSGIPFTVLLDREGKILATGMRAHQLEIKLAEIFGS